MGIRQFIIYFTSNVTLKTDSLTLLGFQYENFPLGDYGGIDFMDVGFFTRN